MLTNLAKKPIFILGRKKNEQKNERERSRHPNEKSKQGHYALMLLHMISDPSVAFLYPLKRVDGSMVLWEGNQLQLSTPLPTARAFSQMWH